MTSQMKDRKPGSVTIGIGSLDMTKAQPRSGKAGTGAAAAGSVQAISAASAPGVKTVPADRTTARSTPAGETQPAPSHGAIDGAGNSARRTR